jgi:nicotinamide mononucleotide transporter
MDGLTNLKKSFKSLKWYEIIMIIIMIFIAAIAVYNAIVNPAGTTNPLWLTIVNFISAICGVICVFFCAKASVSNFIFGLVNTLVYAVYLIYYRIYGTFFLEILFYLPMNIASWINWAKHRDKIEQEKTKSKRLTLKQKIISVIMVAVVTTITYIILKHVGGTVAFLDALTVAIGIVATILELYRYAEQYVWWLITDIIAVTMYIVHFDTVYLTKKTIYLIMAIIGLRNWIQLNKERNKKNE